MKLGRKATAVLVMAVLMMVLFSATASAKPSDINGHWAQKSIEEWVNKGLVSGYPDGTFRPDQEVSRAEFVALANRAFGIKNAGTGIDFSDVSAGDWYNQEVGVANAAGYINGYPDGSFRPKKPISRQEAASVLARLLNLKPSTAELRNFTDSDEISGWARDSVGTAAANGLMAGFPDATFRGARSITRAEAIVSLDRALKLMSVESAVEGTVWLENKPVGEVTIKVFKANSHEVLVKTKTEAEGRYKLELEPGDYDITATTDREVAYKCDIAVVENKISTTDFTLEVGVVVTGILRDRWGRGIEGATVMLTTNPTFITTTIEEGHFTLVVPRNRFYAARAQEPGHEDEEPEVVAEEVEIGLSATQDIGILILGRRTGGGGGGSSRSESISWNSYSDSERTVQSSSFSGDSNTVYMEGSNLRSNRDYKVIYFNPNGDEVRTDTFANIAEGKIDKSSLQLSEYQNTEYGVAGEWHALLLMRASDGGDYEEIANCVFYVEETAIPEFSSVMAAFFVVASCAGIYMGFRRKAAVC
ncbi:MAG: hypothetical protein FH756_07410 [Firmicutes bacterium]|nr:hypothetical protein [Bacillota bacterium]